MAGLGFQDIARFMASRRNRGDRAGPIGALVLRVPVRATRVSLRDGVPYFVDEVELEKDVRRVQVSHESGDASWMRLELIWGKEERRSGRESGHEAREEGQATLRGRQLCVAAWPYSLGWNATRPFRTYCKDRARRERGLRGAQLASASELQLFLENVIEGDKKPQERFGREFLTYDYFNELNPYLIATVPEALWPYEFKGLFENAARPKRRMPPDGAFVFGVVDDAEIVVEKLLQSERLLALAERGKGALHKAVEISLAGPYDVENYPRTGSGKSEEGESWLGKPVEELVVKIFERSQANHERNDYQRRQAEKKTNEEAYNAGAISLTSSDSGTDELDSLGIGLLDEDETTWRRLDRLLFRHDSKEQEVLESLLYWLLQRLTLNDVEQRELAERALLRLLSRCRRMESVEVFEKLMNQVEKMASTDRSLAQVLNSLRGSFGHEGA